MRAIVTPMHRSVQCPGCARRVICPVNREGDIIDRRCPECETDLTAALETRAKALALREATIAARSAVPKPERVME